MRRGETWRLAHPPRTEEEIKEFFNESRINLNLETEYLYNEETGTRWLTYERFLKLGQIKEDNRLLQCLNEIIEYSNTPNKSRNPQVAFFMADETKINPGYMLEVKKQVNL